MLSFNPIVDQPYTSHELPHLVSSCTLVSPQLVELWSCVSSPLLSHTPNRRRTGGSRGATQRGVRFDLSGVSLLTLWRQGWILVRSIFIFYFVRLPLCNKYSDYIVTFISIHYVIIYVVFFGACMRCTRLCPLNPGVTVCFADRARYEKWPSTAKVLLLGVSFSAEGPQDEGIVCN
jgi:hypothetical protein